MQAATHESALVSLAQWRMDISNERDQALCSSWYGCDDISWGIISFAGLSANVGS